MPTTGRWIIGGCSAPGKINLTSVPKRRARTSMSWTTGRRARSAIWDISDPNQPRRLNTKKEMAHKLYLPLIAASGGATQAAVHQVRFRTDETVGNRYWLQTEATYAHPASVRLRSSTVLKDNGIGADAVIVTPKEFSLCR